MSMRVHCAEVKKPFRFTGDFTANVRVRYPDATPACAGKTYKLLFQSRAGDGPVTIEFGTPPRKRAVLPAPQPTNAVVAVGLIDGNGEAEIKNLAGGEAMLFYDLYVDDELVGSVQLPGDEKIQICTITRPAYAGMSAPDAEFRDLSNNEVFKISQLKGKTVYLDFFSTWCVPCQPILAEANNAVFKNREKWAGKVSIVAVGLDHLIDSRSQPEHIASHLRKNGWTALRAAIPTGEVNTRKRADLQFGVQALPTGVLIDEKGKVVWVGIPKANEIEEKINQLLTR
jgi:thiol-disulfide isomerase/thioredoxin